ncbi:hypothetical protein [Ralstonia sp. 1138]|uniref:hypothetical protein n=1 Tax=Ralstonia sp. 1138 TaxID=3156423 RepID=UPI0033951F6E
MQYSKSRPRRPSVFSPLHPLPRCGSATVDDSDYVAGALAARVFLYVIERQLCACAARAVTPAILREQLRARLLDQSESYCAGFLDALWAYIALNLEGCATNLKTWDVVSYLRECAIH